MYKWIVRKGLFRKTYTFLSVTVIYMVRMHYVLGSSYIMQISCFKHISYFVVTEYFIRIINSRPWVCSQVYSTCNETRDLPVMCYWWVGFCTQCVINEVNCDELFIMIIFFKIVYYMGQRFEHNGMYINSQQSGNQLKILMVWFSIHAFRSVS